MAMDRKPLAVMIGLAAKKARGGSDEPDGDEPGGDEDERPEAGEDEIHACEDVIDAMKNRDPKALSEALHNWMEIAGYERSDRGE